MTKGAQRIDYSVFCVVTTIRCFWITRAHLSIVTCRANPDNGAAATGAAGAATPRCPLLTRARGGSYPPLPFAYEGTRGQLPHAALCLRGNAGAATPRCPLLTRERGGSYPPLPFAYEGTRGQPCALCMLPLQYLIIPFEFILSLFLYCPNSESRNI